MTPKRKVQAVMLPYIIERVLALIEMDTEYGIQNPESEGEREELTANLPKISKALELVKDARCEFIPTDDDLARRLEREYMDEFHNQLLKRTTGYGFLCAVYLAHRYTAAGISLDDRVLEAVNAVSVLAESGTNKNAIDGMGRSAWKKSGKLFDRFVAREFVWRVAV